MSKLRFPEPFRHEHPPVRNVNELVAERLTVGQRAADWAAVTVGSWSFILVQSGIFVIWAALNVTAFVAHWDPYPFILMNLVLSMQAAYTAPMIMMSQNRKAMHDRIAEQHDYEINEKAEIEIRAVLEHLASQDRALDEVHQLLLSLTAEKKGS